MNKTILLIYFLSLPCTAHQNDQAVALSSDNKEVKYYALFHAGMDDARGVFFHVPSTGSSLSLGFDHGSQWKQQSPQRFIVVDNFSRHRPEIYSVKFTDKSLRMYDISAIVYRHLGKIEPGSEISVQINQSGNEFVTFSVITQTAEKDVKSGIKIELAEIGKWENTGDFLEIATTPVAVPHDLSTEKLNLDK